MMMMMIAELLVHYVTHIHFHQEWTAKIRTAELSGGRETLLWSGLFGGLIT